MRISDLPGG